ncbi:MAG: DUF5343 domain-containing protein [Nitrososphaerota archaeon]|nr:DUF5343 domain-containing protein [Nitrososphaerota archaeon]
MSVTQMEEVREEEQTLLEERPSKPATSGKRNPPARNTSRFWFERFLSVIQRQNPSVIDSAFLSQIAPSNEGKLLAQLKFLHVIDEQGKPTQLLPKLNMVGEEQKRGFQDIARESYQDLFAELKLDRAVPDDLINFFIRKYAFTRDKAINAAKFFLYLADKASIGISTELASFLTEKITTNTSNGATVQLAAVPRVQERVSRAPVREPKNLSRKSARILSESELQPAIHANIEIKLDKDTPKEYWDRVLALLGENKEVDVQVSTISEQSENSAESSQ